MFHSHMPNSQGCQVERPLRPHRALCTSPAHNAVSTGLSLGCCHPALDGVLPIPSFFCDTVQPTLSFWLFLTPSLLSGSFYEFTLFAFLVLPWLLSANKGKYCQELQKILLGYHCITVNKLEQVLFKHEKIP